MTKDSRIILGAFAGAHGVRGDTRIKAFTQDPMDVGAYGIVFAESSNKKFKLTVKKLIKGDIVLASAPEIATREDADALKGTKFYVERSALPPADENEFYIEDLVGLAAITPEGEPAGRVRAVHNFGAGDILEVIDIPGEKDARMIEFSLANVPAIDVEKGVVTIVADALGDPETTG